MAFVALSYRNSDTRVAKELYLRLAATLGQSSVFLADQTLRVGKNWEPALARFFMKANLVVVVVGDAWAKKPDGSLRLGPNDYVRKELEIAYQGGCRIFIPVLLNETAAPSEEEQDAGGEVIRNLFRRHAMSLKNINDGELQYVCNQIISIIIGVSDIYTQFPVKRIEEAITEAEHCFLVWHTWSEYFKPYLEKPLARFLQKRFKLLEPCNCRILLAHQTCEFADFRARALRKSTPDRLLKKTIADLEEVAAGVTGSTPDQLIEVRLHIAYPSTQPPMPLYIIDERAFFGWYPTDCTSHYSPYIEIEGRLNGLLSYFEKTFSDAWQRAEWKWDFENERPEKVQVAYGSGQGDPPIGI